VHPWLRINRVLRVMLHTRWSAEAWSGVEFKKALAPPRSENPACGLVIHENAPGPRASSRYRAAVMPLGR